MKRKNTITLAALLIAALILTVSCETAHDDDAIRMEVLDEAYLREGFIPVPEDRFEEVMNMEVMPALDAIRRGGTFNSNKDGHRVYYEIFDVEDEKGSVVIMHGFTEFIDKYSEIIWYFTSEGYDVYMPEHFGHGWSERSEENLSKVAVDSFDDTYVDDAFQFVTDVVNKNRDKNKPLVLYGHSMGGGISARMLEKYPGHFDAAILSSPMMGIETGVPEWLASFFAGSAKAFGAGSNYIFGHYDFVDEDLFDDPSSVCTSYPRYRYFLDMRTNDEYRQMYGATWYWLDTAIDATKAITAEKEARKVVIPTLLFQAENDTLVKNGAHLEFAQHAKDVTVIFCPDTRHEIMNSPDGIVAAYWSYIFDFLDEVL